MGKWRTAVTDWYTRLMLALIPESGIELHKNRDLKAHEWHYRRVYKENKEKEKQLPEYTADTNMSLGYVQAHQYQDNVSQLADSVLNGLNESSNHYITTMNQLLPAVVKNALMLGTTDNVSEDGTLRITVPDENKDMPVFDNLDHFIRKSLPRLLASHGRNTELSDSHAMILTEFHPRLGSTERVSWIYFILEVDNRPVMIKYLSGHNHGKPFKVVVEVGRPGTRIKHPESDLRGPYTFKPFFSYRTLSAWINQNRVVDIPSIQDKAYYKAFKEWQDGRPEDKAARYAQMALNTSKYMKPTDSKPVKQRLSIAQSKRENPLFKSNTIYPKTAVTSVRAFSGLTGQPFRIRLIAADGTETRAGTYTTPLMIYQPSGAVVLQSDTPHRRFVLRRGYPCSVDHLFKYIFHMAEEPGIVRYKPHRTRVYLLRRRRYVKQTTRLLDNTGETLYLLYKVNYKQSLHLEQFKPLHLKSLSPIRYKKYMEPRKYVIRKRRYLHSTKHFRAWSSPQGWLQRAEKRYHLKGTPELVSSKPIQYRKYVESVSVDEEIDTVLKKVRALTIAAGMSAGMDYQKSCKVADNHIRALEREDMVNAAKGHPGFSRLQILRDMFRNGPINMETLLPAHVFRIVYRIPSSFKRQHIGGSGNFLTSLPNGGRFPRAYMEVAREREKEMKRYREIQSEIRRGQYDTRK